MARRELLVSSTGEVRPGAWLALDLGEGVRISVVVPADASDGDRLVLVQGEGGSWKCLWESGGRAPGVAGTAAADSAGEDEVLVRVPTNAAPGLTQLEVATGRADATALRVTVPSAAVPGDVLGVSHQGDGTWRLRIIRPRGGAEVCAGDVSAPAGIHGVRRRNIVLPHAEAEPQEALARMAAAATDFGASVNPKLSRGIAPSGLCGMLASEPIAAGEELISMPYSAHISVRTCRERAPRLCGAILQLQGELMERESEAVVAACVARLLVEAAQRTRCGAPEDAGGVGADAGGTTPELSDACGAAPELWRLYAEALLSERFEAHPYFLCLTDPLRLEASLDPSHELRYLAMMAGDVMAFRRALAEHVAPELLGPGFDESLFLRARLSILTRVFDLALDGGTGVSSLVPIVDFFNHGADAGAAWRLDAGRRAMVVYAKRAHATGEEILLSYGHRSNVLLYRTYGFTLPPSAEPSWTFVAQCTGEGDLDQYRTLPPGLKQRTPIQLEVPGVHDTLVAAFECCRANGNNPTEFLRQLCEQSIAPYRNDSGLRPALAALARARRADAASAAWWADAKETGGPVVNGHDTPDDELATHALRVKMSEYLSIVTHLEALDVMAGRLARDSCLSAALRLCAPLKKAIEG